MASPECLESGARRFGRRMRWGDFAFRFPEGMPSWRRGRRHGSSWRRRRHGAWPPSRPPAVACGMAAEGWGDWGVDVTKRPGGRRRRGRGCTWVGPMVWLGRNLSTLGRNLNPDPTGPKTFSSTVDLLPASRRLRSAAAGYGLGSCGTCVKYIAKD